MFIAASFTQQPKSGRNPSIHSTDKWIGLPRWHSGKASACQCRRHRRCRFNPWVGKISWRKKRQPTPVFLPGKSHGPRNLVGYSPWGRKESDTTKSNLACEHDEWNRIHAYDITLWVCAKSLLSCLTLCDPMDCSPSGSSVHGILQARILERVVVPSFRGSSWPKDQTLVSHLPHWQAGSLPLVLRGKPTQS